MSTEPDAPRIAPLPSAARAVLDAVWDIGPFTTSDAMAATGLTRTTVIAQCSALVEAGWLEDLEDARTAGHAYQGGRPSRRFAFRPRAGLVMGLDAGEHRMTGVIADLAGQELIRLSEQLGDDAHDAARRRARIDALLQRLVTEARVRGERVLCTVIGVPAPVEPEGPSRPGRNPFWDLMDPGLRTGLVHARGELILENDANLAALAEHRVGAAQAWTTSATLLSGERFGAGIIVDGRLIRGARGGAGEMHALELVQGVGEAYGLGALARRWLRSAQAAGEVPRDSPLHSLPDRDIDSETVFLAAEEGDPFAVALIDRLGERLARIAAVLAALLDIEGVVVSGAIAASLDPVLERARHHLSSLALPPVPLLAASPLGRGVVSRGAAVRAIQAVRERALRAPGARD